MVSDACRRDHRPDGREPSVYFVLIALLPALAFWGLGGFYLGQGRLFRRLHEDVVAGKVDPFFMDPSKYEEW